MTDLVMYIISLDDFCTRAVIAIIVLLTLAVSLYFVRMVIEFQRLQGHQALNGELLLLRLRTILEEDAKEERAAKEAVLAARRAAEEARLAAEWAAKEREVRAAQAAVAARLAEKEAADREGLL